MIGLDQRRPSDRTVEVVFVALEQIARFQPHQACATDLVQQIGEVVPDYVLEAGLVTLPVSEIQLVQCFVLIRRNFNRQIKIRRLSKRNYRIDRSSYPKAAHFKTPNHLRKLIADPGIPISELFRVMVYRDKNILEMVQACDGSSLRGLVADNYRYIRIDNEHMLGGNFSKNSSNWPVVFNSDELLSQWFFPGIDTRLFFNNIEATTHSERSSAKIVQYAARFIRDRYEAMMIQLRVGRLKAFGHTSSGGRSEPISPALWSAPKIRVDFINNEIGYQRQSQHGASSIDGVSNDVETMWLGVTVIHKAVEAAEPTVPVKEKPKKKGAPLKHPWNNGIDWLILELMKDGMFPQSFGALAQKLDECLTKAGAPKSIDGKYLKDVLANDFPELTEVCTQPRGRASRRNPRGE